MKTRLTISILALSLGLAACGGAQATTAPTTGAQATSAPPLASIAPSAEVDGTPFIVKDFTLDPLQVTAATGPVAFAVTNEGPTVHNLTIRDDADEVLSATADLRSGEAETLTADLPEGSYVLFCSLPGHESLGMKGTLTVAP